MPKKIPTMCLNCSTVCGMIVTVDQERIRKIEGNPLDPNSRGKLCAKGQAAITMVEDPDRLRFPMKRTGPRGSRQWQRIEWDEAIDMVATRLKTLRQTGKIKELMVQYGRDRTNGFLDRFVDALGTPNKLGHRGLCSLNKRMAIKASIGDTDWDTPDLENSKVILNFGSNFFEAHQGHVGMLNRVAKARRDGAYLVTFDVRLSNTAAQSDEWIPIRPGTDGIVALAIGHVIFRDGLDSRSFLNEWTNVNRDTWFQHYMTFTPQWAERESGVSQSVIERLAHRFAQSAPNVTTLSNRGAHAHENGFNNERAILCLNAVVGSIGEPGGWSYTAGDVNQLVPQPQPIPPKPTLTTQLSHPIEFPVANNLYPRAVSSLVYPDLASGRVHIDTLISYYVNAPMSWPQGPTSVRTTLLDEDVIPFHVAIDAFDSETVEVADLVLPDATFLEKWDLDARNSLEFQPYVGLRQPVVTPPHQCRDIRDILAQIARATDPEVAQYFPDPTAESFVRRWAQSVPGGLERLQRDGIWVSEAKQPIRDEFKHPVGLCSSDEGVMVRNDGIVEYRPGPEQEATIIGRVWNGHIVKGFNTLDRCFQFELTSLHPITPPDLKDGLRPNYHPITQHKNLRPNEFFLTTFKWNVHTQSRTANQVWLTEIVSNNPCWIHPFALRQLGLRDGGQVAIYRTRPIGDASPVIVEMHATEAIHPKVLAISASFGHWRYGRIAQGRGVNPNALIPPWVDPLGGGQAWNDTVVRLDPL